MDEILEKSKIIWEKYLREREIEKDKERMQSNTLNEADIVQVNYKNPPQNMDQFGKDQEPMVEPNFSSGEELQQLMDLKKELEILERELHSAEVFGKDSKALQEKFATVQNKVEDLSNILNEMPEKWKKHLFRYANKSKDEK